MWNRVIFLIALMIAVALLLRVSDTVETAIDVFPIDREQIQLVDLDFALWLRLAFIAGHACVAWFVIQIRRRNATLPLKILTFILFSELIAIYVVTLRFWYGGIEGIRLY